VDTQKLVGSAKNKAQSSEEIQDRVQKARDIQTKRFKGTNVRSNAEMSTKDVKTYCPLSPECRTMMISATASMNLSARSYFKVIKIARTIADLVGDQVITTSHLAEALQYRPKDTEF
jgi:magnesium chelatase family protein